ncbi:hypothetical protein V6N12_008024 [Hibiscus sabdariffa]|uniref:KIB1-4 beta-propeller domain-containing protein n=1 Tax=Hibiscus sabdariffa TaxID=183260 RepID=A0ABR2BSN8_9ROSI
MENDGRGWTEMKSLGYSALFISDTISLSVVASDFPGCRPNCMYYTETDLRASCSSYFVVYNMETGSLTPVYTADDARLAEIETQPPIWIAPSFKLNSEVGTESFTPYYATNDLRLAEIARRPPIWIVPSFKPKLGRAPQEPVASILQRLVSVSDYFRFGAVCRAWHSAIMEDIDYLLPPPFPMLFVPSHAKNVWNLYSITDHKLLPLQFLVPCTARFVGFSSRLLLTVDDHLTVQLLNPLYLFLGEQIRRNPNACITLPPLDTAVFIWDGVRSDNHHIHKVVVSPNKYMVIAIIVDCMQSVVCSKVNDNEPRALFRLGQNVIAVTPSRKHLIESTDGELLMVDRRGKGHGKGPGHQCRIEFKVWRMKYYGWKWMEMQSLGDCALFISDAISFSVVASDFPGCRPNCIYYIDADLRRSCSSHFVVYDMETRSLTPEYKADDARLGELETQPPIWIVPSFKLK